MPVALKIGLIYFAARLVTTAFFLTAADLSGPSSRFGRSPSITDFVLGWDAQWYWRIAHQGYPITLPIDEVGHVAENAWAFMPVFPYIAQAVGLPFGAYGAGAFIVSLVAGYFACLALYRLLHWRIDEESSLWAVAFFACGPVAALFQVGYAETLFLLLLFLALDATARGRYALLYLLVPLMAFTRPGVLAFALFLGLYGISRWMRRQHDPLRRSEVVHILLLGALATATGFAWQVIAALVTGRADAYLATELAWRRHWGTGEEGFVPFEGWIEASHFWFRFWGMPGWLGVVVLAILVMAVAAALLWSPQVRALGVDIRLWSAAYILYLLAVFFPQSSTLRLLVPLSPLWGAVALPRGPWYRWAVLLACLFFQWIWIWQLYALGYTFWQVP